MLQRTFIISVDIMLTWFIFPSIHVLILQQTNWHTAILIGSGCIPGVLLGLWVSNNQMKLAHVVCHMLCT